MPLPGGDHRAQVLNPMQVFAANDFLGCYWSRLDTVAVTVVAAAQAAPPAAVAPAVALGAGAEACPGAASACKL